VYTSSILRGAPYAFYKISFTYQKKNYIVGKPIYNKALMATKENKIS